MKFTPINPEKFARGQMFYYFSKMAPTGYSLTVKLDVTRLYSAVKAAGVKFFPAYLWLVTKNLNRQVEFRLCEKDGVLGCYDTLTPMYAAFHDDDKTFSLMWTEYSDSFAEFYKRYLENQKQYGENHGVLSQPATPPENCYTVSCIPWVGFEHFAVHSYDGTKGYYFPSVEAGKYEKQGERLMMPLSLTCHHAATDGYHVHLFLDSLQKDFDAFGELI